MSEKNEKLEKAETVSDKPEKAVKADKTDKKKKAEKKARKRPFAEMISELKKVSWPSKEDLRTYTACVLVFVVVCAVVLFVMDIGVTWVIDYISDPDKLPSTLNGWFGIGG